MTYPIIEALKSSKSHFNTDQFISLDPNSAFGNLNLSWMEIVVRIECVNDLIVTLYDDFYKLQVQFNNTHTGSIDQTYRQKLYTEQIFYWLRKTTDELISMVSLLTDKKSQGAYPKKIKISSIGEFLKTKAAFTEDFENYQQFFTTLNEISNGFKHSFINSQIHAYHGSEYPVVFAYTLYFNDRSNQPKYHTLDLRQVLNDYNNFLVFIKQYIITNFEIKK